MKKATVIFFVILIVASATLINGIFIDDTAKDDNFGDCCQYFFKFS